MKVEAYSEAAARLLVKKKYGYTEKQIKLTTIKKPINIFWGLIKKKGQYQIKVQKPKKNSPLKKPSQEEKNGYVEIKDGILKVVNPNNNGRYPFIIAKDPNIELFVNDKTVKGTIILTEQDRVKFKTKTIEPITKIIVKISDDKMQAILKIHKENGKKFYIQDSKKDVGIRICSSFKEIKSRNVTLEECLQALEDAHIKSEFIDTEAIKKLIKIPMGGSSVVAKGKKPISGVKAQIKYYFNDESIVQIGDVLATKVVPALPGKDGLTVTGETVKAIEAKDDLPKSGKGTIVLGNNIKVVAATSGRPIIQKGTISVIPLLVISGDVNKETGDIKFDGDIIIKGNVMDYMKVIGKGKVKIFGSIFNAEVISNEDINITGKVISGKIIAGMDMINYFCINPLIEEIAKIINKFFKQIEVHAEKDLQMIFSTAYSKRITLKKYIKKTENLLPFLENDNMRTVSNLLKKIKNSLSNINSTKIEDNIQLKNLYKELIEYIRLNSNLYLHKANITLQYAQNADIQSSGKVIVTGEGSYQSNIIAKETILYKSPTSNVKGGILIAGQNIKAGNIGSYSGIHTYCKVLDKNGKVNAHCYHGTIINIANKYLNP